MRLFYHKLIHWEYWPYQISYAPVYFLWAFYALKSRTLFFFNASNPTIANGGFMGESKIDIYKLIPPKYFPKTIFIKAGTSLESMLESFAESNIGYPLYAKPDMGLRGMGVKKITSETELKTYHAKADFDYLVQDLIPYPNEAGVFYVRYPNEKAGRITGIAAKEFAIVTGDGISTVEELAMQNPRYALQLKSLRREHGDKMNDVLAAGEKRNIIPYGNHARGTRFVDVAHRITPRMTEMINEICLQIPGYYYGRLDIMYDTFEELERGENFALVEINGAGSEPIHMYDPKHSIFHGWKEMLRHIRYMYEISVENHKNGAPYLTHKEGMRQYKIHLDQSKKIVNF
ncbi:MAG: D-alanine--D-alanine ligase [Flavobacterium sp.]|nr:MAG: D-alanine--D-alanine ligase [Flavobacterium sp.]